MSATALKSRAIPHPTQLDKLLDNVVRQYHLLILHPNKLQPNYLESHSKAVFNEYLISIMYTFPTHATKIIETYKQLEKGEI